jgi:uncharacterized protein YhbP (UPF0306 family)
LLAFLRQHRYAVQATVARAGGVQAAVVGIAVSDQFEIVFDTLASTRKSQNLGADSRIAFVIGGLTDGAERTVQYEGLAEVPVGADAAAVRELYFHTFPDGRERLAWPGIIHWRVRPLWLRYSDFGKVPPMIAEFDARGLAALR